jgi:hypothetical protein
MKIWARLAIVDAMTCVVAYMSGQDAPLLSSLGILDKAQRHVSHEFWPRRD